MVDVQALPQRAADALARLRERRPRIHCLMNTVVQKLVADGVTALGAIPSMTSSVEEIGEFAQRAEALLVNLGTLDADRRAANNRRPVGRRRRKRRRMRARAWMPNGVRRSRRPGRSRRDDCRRSASDLESVVRSRHEDDA